MRLAGNSTVCRKTYGIVNYSYNGFHAGWRNNGIMGTGGICHCIVYKDLSVGAIVVGAKESIHPLCTIVVIIAGEMLWGVPGMVLAITLMGIVKIICDNIPELQPYGFLIGEVKSKKGGK